MRIFITGILCFVFFTCNAAHYFNSWYRITVGVAIKEKWRVDAEFNYRRQNDLGSQNPFDRHLLMAFRPWIIHRTNDRLTLAFSPFAYFRNYPIILREKDRLRKATNEFRFSAYADFQQPLARRFFSTSRFWVEYRLFENEPKHVIRLRFRMGLRYDFSKKTSLQIFEEAFFNVSDFSKIHSFDHNRVFTQFAYTPHPSIRLELGYIFVMRLPRTAIKAYPESNVVLNVLFTIPAGKNRNNPNAPK
jgi:hypothetical protein